MVKQLSTEEFKAMLLDKQVHLLDVREAYEFKQGYIKDALLVPSTNFDEIFDALKIKKQEKIALYCRSGSRSFFIAEKLNGRGYEKLFNLELGLLDWEKKGFGVEK